MGNWCISDVRVRCAKGLFASCQTQDLLINQLEQEMKQLYKGYADRISKDYNYYTGKEKEEE